MSAFHEMLKGIIDGGRNGAAMSPPGDAGFDPSNHSVADVEAFVAAHPDQLDAVLAAEAEGKGRKSIAALGD